MDEDVLAAYLNCPHQLQGAVGRVPSQWLQTVLNAGPIPGLPIDQILQHADHPLPPVRIGKQWILKRRNDGASNLELFILIMAWGGMNYGHARLALAQWRGLEAIIEQIRSSHLNDGNPNRQASYQLLLDARIPGLGPAFFTKLIAFCLRDGSGVIMDQWLARSVNVFFHVNGIMMPLNAGRYVPQNTTSGIFERFCRYVEDISVQAGESLPLTEERLFSHGGRPQGEWRQLMVQFEHQFGLGPPG